MGFRSEVLAYSIGLNNQKLVTAALRYPRLVHAEVMTHREFSRNASSSRAIPVAKVIEQVRNDPAMPVHWGTNKPGMQAGEELTGFELERAQTLWLQAAEQAADVAEQMMDMGLHKQVANRILEPYQWMHTIVTTVSKTNWNGLRLHKDADPNIYRLAQVWDASMVDKHPILLHPDEWHLPYITAEDWEEASRFNQVGRITRDMPKYQENLEVVRKVSAARCARVSYLNHEGKKTAIDEDLKLFDRLVRSEIIHASPTEHQATPDDQVWSSVQNKTQWANPHSHGNLPGWIQFRKLIPNEYIDC